ncbi:MAG TPA: AI-2E family transporter [Ktedonobacteraceae bacterium]|nr:AI-2E family transporter [Ktedonobacteraceae bacterium]
MKSMMVRGSPVIRPLLAAAALVIVVFGLKYSSDVLAPIFLAATLAILFTPALWWLEKKGLPSWLALVVMVLALGGFIILLIFILTTSLEQLSLHMPEYAELLHQRINTLGAALGTIGIDLQESLNTMVVDTTELAHSAIDVALGVLSNGVAIVFFLFLLFLMLVESRSIASKFQARLQTGNNLAIQLGNYTRQIQKQYRIQAMSNLLSAVALTAEFLLFRIDGAFLWGFLAFILGFIPNVGLIIACLPAVIIAFILHGIGTALVILVIGIILNATMDNAVTPRIYGKGLNLPVLLVFTSFIFWSWVFGFVGALLAIPATLFVKALLQGRQETRFLVVLLSGKDEGETAIIPVDGGGESNAVEDQDDIYEDGHIPLIVEPTDTSTNED